MHGEADDLPDMEAGDIVVLVMQRPHKVFERKGADLVMEKKINLLEALTGVDFVLTHLDGRTIRITSEPGQVIKPGMLMTVVGAGMPFHKKSYEFGNLFVKFDIVFPNSTTSEAAQQLTLILCQSPGQKQPQVKQGEYEEEQKLQKLEDSHKNTHAAGGKVEDQEEDDEDEEMHGGQRVGCQQQ